MPKMENPAAGKRQGSESVIAWPAGDSSEPTARKAIHQGPIVLSRIAKNSREAFQIEAVQTDEGPRVSLMLYRLHGDRSVPIRCLGRFRIEVLHDLAEGIRAAELLFSGDRP